MLNDTTLVPVSNWPLYLYRLFFKWFAFVLFGVGSLCLMIFVMPVMFLLFHPREKARQNIRRQVSASFKGFIALLCWTKVMRVDVQEPEAFKNLQSKILVANHPSLLDVVILISLIPNADVIVKGSLAENIIVSGIIRCLYIQNTLDFETLAASCIASLKQGNCLVIFPEGTRTPRSGEMRLKKGAARISLLSGAEILAVHIGGTDKYGLGKKDPLTAFNHTDKYVYCINIQRRLNPENYAGMETHRAVKRLNAEILEALNPPEPL